VFAKLEVSSMFDWSWQPDRLQEPKHYIFHALNPVNGLEYGHQAMIAYNKKLVLANTAPRLRLYTGSSARSSSYHIRHSKLSLQQVGGMAHSLPRSRQT
jgi:hypothetical protein